MNTIYFDIIGNEISVNDMVMVSKKSKGMNYFVAGKITSINDDNIEVDTVMARGEEGLKGNIKIKPKYKIKTNDKSLVKVEFKKAI
jgi:hypothetical protein